ncbi:MAG TPA: hypothetical protein VLM89_11185 [Phycisphaerae bacterium]|nr:hypothetical protein [Phycisphaerae bacterium]
MGVGRASSLPLLASILALTLTAQAQDAAKEPNWGAVRKGALAAIDRNTVQRWFDARIQDLLTNEDPKAVQKNAAEFHKKLMEQYNASDAAPQFKDDLAALLAAGFSKTYNPSTDSAKPPHPLGAAMVLMVLRDFAHPAGLPCFKTALTDPTPAPRFMATEGLNAIRQRLSEQDWAAIIPDLQKAAGREFNNPSLSRMYQLLFAAAENNNRMDAVATALMGALDNRALGFEQDNRFPLRADGEAAAWLADKAIQGNNNTLRVAVCRRAARLLANAVFSYLNDRPNSSLQEQLELVVLSIEPKLEALAKASDRNVKIPEPTVRAAMLGGTENRHNKMTAALNLWIGSGQTQGVLNNPPFSFPVGLEITRKQPATATAPAS